MTRTHESENTRGYRTGIEIAHRYGPALAKADEVTGSRGVEDKLDAMIDLLASNHIRDIESAGSFDPEHESDLYVAQHVPANFTESSEIVIPGIHSDRTDLGESFARGLAEGLTSGLLDVLRNLHSEQQLGVIRPQFGKKR